MTNKVVKKELVKVIKEPHILIYDKDNIQYVKGNYARFDWAMDTLDDTRLLDGSRTMIPSLCSTLTVNTTNTEQLDNIELDETTMKRIAKFNKGQEIKRLDAEIKEKKEQIANIEEVLNDRTKRLKKLKDFITDIYNIDTDEEDDYDDYDY